MDQEDERAFINLTEWWAFAWSHRLAFLIAFVASATAGVATFLVLPKTFTPRATVLPTQPASPLSGLAAQLGGINLGMGEQQSMATLYPEIARSRSVLVGALDASYHGGTFRRALATELGIGATGAKLEDRLLRYFQGKLRVSVDPLTNFVAIELGGRDPRLTTDVLNEIVRQMDRFIQQRMRTQSRGEREMISVRLAEEAGLLREAENRLQRFREANREIGLSPAGLMEQARLAREVEIHSTLYIELTRQLEVARVEEYRRTPVVSVLDWAVPPLRKSGPKGSLVLFGFVSVGLLGTMIWLKVREMRSARRTHDGPRDATLPRVGALAERGTA